MTNLGNEFLVFAVPHVFSRLDPQAKQVVRKNYRRFKTGMITGTYVAVRAVDGYQLTKDVISSKLNAYGYKKLWAVMIGPAIEFSGLPLYIFTYGSRFRKYSIAIINFGPRIIKSQMGFVDLMWAPLDVGLFGELVSYNENCTNATMTLLHNESATVLQSVVSSAILGDGGDKEL